MVIHIYRVSRNSKMFFTEIIRDKYRHNHVPEFKKILEELESKYQKEHLKVEQLLKRQGISPYSASEL